MLEVSPDTKERKLIRKFQRRAVLSSNRSEGNLLGDVVRTTAHKKLSPTSVFVLLKDHYTVGIGKQNKPNPNELLITNP
jgi:hypothetical protein